jgi:hypothetical protein
MDNDIDGLDHIGVMQISVQLTDDDNPIQIRQLAGGGIESRG